MMKILIDMNLSPDWAPILSDSGFDAIHWSNVGDPRASDQEIMNWAKAKGYVVFTHDLDFGAILSATKAKSPSVIQIRTQDINPYHISDLIISALIRFNEHLSKGAIISLDEEKARARILPINLNGV